MNKRHSLITSLLSLGRVVKYNGHGRRCLSIRSPLNQHENWKWKNGENLPKKQEKSEIDGYKGRSTSVNSAPAPLDVGIEAFLKREKKPYVPKLQYSRVNNEYQGLPNAEPVTNNSPPVTRTSRYIPKLIILVTLLWGGYTIKVWFFKPEEGADSPDLLSPHEYHKFLVTHKEEIDPEHLLIELLPKHNHWQYSYYVDYEQKTIWNGERIWSVTIKQPEIMVERSYTPLPLYFMKSELTRSGEKEPLLRVINNADDLDKNGKMCLYIKKYQDGEVSNYIAKKKVGDELELRGPHTTFRFPYHPTNEEWRRPAFKDIPSKTEADPVVHSDKEGQKLPEIDNIVFYAGGTGIAPILQTLFSKNPYRGFIYIHYSARKHGEIRPFERYLYFLEKMGRIKFIPHYDDVLSTRLGIKDIENPAPFHYLSPQKTEELAVSSSGEQSKLKDQKLKATATEEVPQEQGRPREKKELRMYFKNAIEQAIHTSKNEREAPSIALVCGPEGYITYVAGARDLENNNMGPVKGLLGNKNWNNSNTFKL